MDIIYTASRVPDYSGARGDAWRIDVPSVRERLGTTPEQDSLLAAWIVRAPHAHPLWHSYMVGVIHLRDIPGAGPAKGNLDGATHEVFVYALVPEEPTTVNAPAAFLTPANFHGQFIEPSDDAAALRIEQTVMDVCDGTLNPDTDNRRQWIERFSGSNLKVGALLDDVVLIEGDKATVIGTGAGITKALDQMTRRDTH